MALTVGELVGYLKLDNKGWKRGLREGRQDFDGFWRDANGRLHDQRGRFVREGHAIGAGLGDGLAGGVSRGVGRVVRALGSATGALIGFGAKAGAVTLAVGALAASVANLTGVVAGLGGALVAASGSLLILPGVAAAAAAAIGTLKVGLLGVGEALENIGDAEKFAEALQGLAPSAQEFATTIRDLKPAFDGLRLDVQQELFRGLGGVVRDLADAYLPVLRDGMSGIAAEFNLAAKEVADFLMTSGAVSDVDTIFGNTKETVANLRAALAPLGQAFLDIATVASEFLPSLTAGAGDAAEAFAEFIRHARDSGQLGQWIQTGLQTLAQLGQVIGNIGSIIGSVFSASNEAGAGFLATLETLTGGLADFLNSAEGTRLLADIFGAIKSITDGLAPLFAEIGSVLSDTVGPALADLAPMIGDAFRALIPAVRPLGEALAALAPVIGVIAQQFATVLAAAIQAVAPVIVELAPLFADLAEMLGGLLVDAIEAIAPHLPTLARAFVDIMAAVLPMVGAVGEELVGALGDVLDAIIPVIPELVDKLLPAIVDCTPAFVDLVKAILPILPPLARLVADILPYVVDLMVMYMNVNRDAAPYVIGLIEVIVKVVAWLIDHLVPAIETVIDWAAAFGKGIADAGRAIGRAVGHIVGWFRDMRDRAGDAIDAVIDKAKEIGGKVKDAFAGAGRWLLDSGKKIVQGLIDGIKAMIGAVGDAVGEVADTVRDYWPFSPAKRGPLRDHPMDKAGRNIAAMLAGGMTSGQGLVEQAVAGLAGRVALPAVAAPGVAPYAATAGRLGVPTTDGAVPADRAGDRGGRSLVHIENFHAAGQSPYEIGAELDWQSRSTGGTD